MAWLAGHSAKITGLRTRILAASALLGLVLVVQPMTSAPAFAQSLALTVNDSPITNYDLEQRMRLLRVLRKPASRDAAIESLINDRLMLMEVRKYSINPSEQEIVAEATREAAESKITPQQLAAGLQRARIDKDHWLEHWRAVYSWQVLIRAFNKQVSVSEDEVRAEIAKSSGKTSLTEYQLQPITFVIAGSSANAGTYNARAAEANQLRARFRDCATGIQLARALRDVAVQPLVTRRASALSPQFIAILDRTPVGQLTAPQRSPTGIEVIAVCKKSDGGTGNSASETVRETLLTRKLKGQAAQRLKDLREKAVIVRRR